MNVVKLALARGMHVPVIRKCWSTVTGLPLMETSLHNIARRLFPLEQRIWVRIRYKEFNQGSFWLSVEPRYEDGHYLGIHEVAVQKFFVSHLKPGDCFYDVGAHTGFFSILAAALVGKRGSVIALEPDRRNAALLREAIARNSLGSITDTVEQAVWSFEGNIRLLSANPGPHSNTGMSKIVPANVPDSYEVPCTSLDKLSRGRPAPTLIKIDVEGAESEVLKGAHKLFESSRPSLLCEIHDETNATFVQFWLAQREYAFRWLEQAEGFPRHLVASPRG